MGIQKNQVFTLSVLVLCFSLNINLSIGADNISANQSLSGDQTIVSSGGNFALGFFKPGNSSNYYIGIWYNKVSVQTVVWVANRERPVSDEYSSVLKVIDGNLVLLNESQIPIWSTSMNSTTLNSVVAVLLDDGNLVLRDESDSSLPIWQSFDYPTHTFLPGAKIANNKRTQTKTVLTSWKNSEDPAPGLFSLELDQNGNQYILRWNRSEQYWTSGLWNGQNFTNVPEMRLNYIYNYSFVSNDNESYFTYSLYNISIISRFIMDVSGQIKQLTWLENAEEWNLFWSQPRRQCEVYAYCGGFGTCNQNSWPLCNCFTGFTPRSWDDWDLNDYSGGCARKTNLQCGNTDGFMMGSIMRFPDRSQFVGDVSVAECESTCLGICSCTAYVYGSDGCSIWNGDLLNLQQLSKDYDGRRTIHIRLAASELSSSQNSKGIVIGAVVGSVAVVVILLGLILVVIRKRQRSTTYISYRRRKMARRQECRGIIGENLHLYDSKKRVEDLIDLGDIKEDDKKDIDVPFFDLESILAATDNFSITNKLGQGGFGPVYKGKFPGGREIAVKRLSSNSGQGIEEFKNEVMLIAKLQHRNLVRLLGYCIKVDEKILIYEYMPNKSLDAIIFDKTLCMLLSWEKRFDIILGIARGLLYLHQDSRLRIIHRDMKTGNILLDEEMNPKISDFGLARIVGGKETKANTNRVVGTYGYMSPEYALDGLFSVKSDVFSFGVVVLEIISGKRNTGFYQSQEAMNLLGYAWRLWKEEKVLDLMDQTLLKSYNKSEVLKCIIVGLLCVQDDHSDRPTMSDVVFMLGSETATLSNPKRPAFVARRHLSSTPPSSSIELEAHSNNELTDTMEEGR